MAITNNGTKNSLPEAQIPTGYTRPSVTEFTDWESSAKYILTVLKTTVENSTTSITMDNIFDEGVIGLDKQILDIVDADYIATQTVTTWADCIKLELNNSDVSSGDGVWLDDTPQSYKATVILYVKTSA